MKYFTKLSTYLIVILGMYSNSVKSQYIRVSKGMVKYNKTDVCYIEKENDSFILNSLDKEKSYKFDWKDGKFINGKEYRSYVITDLNNNKSNTLFTNHKNELLGSRESFLRNFSKAPFEIITEYGFSSKMIDILLDKAFFDIDKHIKYTNDSISSQISISLKKAVENNIKITYDGKIFHEKDDEKKQIAKIERVVNQNVSSYKFYILKDDNFEFIGYYTYSGRVNTNFFGKPEELVLKEELIIKGDKKYIVKYVKESSNLPLSQDKTVYNLFTILYNNYQF